MRTGAELSPISSVSDMPSEQGLNVSNETSGTVADAFGSRMLGGCWVGGGDSAGMVRPPSTRDGSPARPGTGTATRRTVSQAGGKQSHLRAACERRYSRKYGRAKST